MNKYIISRLVLLLLGLLSSHAALAYVGPGSGLSLLGALWGLLAALGAALVFIILWPLRRYRRRRQANRAAQAESTHRAQPSAGNAEHK